MITAPVFLLTALLPAEPAAGGFQPPPGPTSPPGYATSYAPAAFGAATALPTEENDGWSFSYTFLEVGAARADLDQLGDDADTYYGFASLDLFNLLYLFLGYENSSVDFNNTKTDLWTIGAGVHFSVAERLDILADLAFVYSDLSSDTISDSSNGHQLRAGARWLAMPFEGGGLELAGRGIWLDLDDSYFSDNNAPGFDLEARVHFLKRFSVAMAYRRIEGDSIGALNARFSF